MTTHATQPGAAHPAAGTRPHPATLDGGAAPRQALGVLVRHTGRYADGADPHPSLAIRRLPTTNLSCLPDSVLIDRNGTAWPRHGNEERHAVAFPCDILGCVDYVVIDVEYSPGEGQYSTSAQKQEAIRVTARLIRLLGTDAGTVRAHHEACHLEIRDPFEWDMVSFRDAVRHELQRQEDDLLTDVRELL